MSYIIIQIELNSEAVPFVEGGKPENLDQGHMNNNSLNQHDSKTKI